MKKDKIVDVLYKNTLYTVCIYYCPKNVDNIKEEAVPEMDVSDISIFRNEEEVTEQLSIRDMVNILNTAK